jgi:hypothetical protein
VYATTALQSGVASVHFYPYVIVIEKAPAPIPEFVAPMHGSEWQPFLGAIGKDAAADADKGNVR